MKRVLKMGIILTFMLFILTGCTNTEYNVKINRNGSGKVNYSVEFDNEALKQALKIEETANEDEEIKEFFDLVKSLELFSSSIEKAQKNGYTTEEIIKDNNIVGYTATREFENISEEFVIADSVVEEYVTISDDTGIKIEKNFFTTKYTQSFTIDLTKGGDVINKVKISYDFPKGFTKSNADEKASILATTLTWNLGKGEIKTIEYTVYSLNLPVIIIIVAIIVLIIVLVIVLVKNAKRTKIKMKS